MLQYLLNLDSYSKLLLLVTDMPRNIFEFCRKYVFVDLFEIVNDLWVNLPLGADSPEYLSPGSHLKIRRSVENSQLYSLSGGLRSIQHREIETTWWIHHQGSFSDAAD